MRRWLRSVLLGIAIGSGAWGPALLAQAPERALEPLPLDLVVSLRGHNGRSPIDLSPDGEWLAHTVRTENRVPRDSVSSFHSATGFSFAEGDARMEATLTHTRTGEVVSLGGSEAASWAAAWSPDGARVAFYSDESGEAGLWIWERETRATRRIPGVIVRPFFGFETPRWISPDELLVKLTPGGMTIAEANALGWPEVAGDSRFPTAGPGEPSVLVRRSAAMETPRGPEPTPDAPAPDAGEPAVVQRSLADLAIVDVSRNSVDRIVERRAVRYYAPSPDGRYVAYTIFTGGEPNTQQPLFDLVVHDRQTSRTVELANDTRLGYGIEWSWSPHGKRLAYVETGQRGGGDIVVFSVPDGAVVATSADGVPSFDSGDGEYPPIWSPDGRHIYGVASGALWRVDAASGQGTEVASIPGWEMRSLVTRPERSTVWLSDREKLAWVVARDESGGESGLFSIDLVSGQTTAALREPKSYSAVFNLDASHTTGEIAFVSTGQEHPSTIWTYSTRDSRLRGASRLNPGLDRVALGRAHVISWRTEDGDSLAGSLLLPPGYREGERVPLVVWVYGGSRGSAAVNRFGLTGIGQFNMQVLATRGYAVLFPDAPLREGRTSADLARTVLPGVDAAIAQGYADPDRLAIMGQSYGSYSTLAIITQTTRFKAAIITAAVLHPDLFADYLRSPGYYERGQGNMGGTPWEYPERYRDNSPLFDFDRVETPVLIGQGERDGDLVPAEAIFTALQRLEKPVEYRLYEGEGHVITQAPNVIDFWERRLEFLAEHLELRVDTQSPARGSATVPTGATRLRRPGRGEQSAPSGREEPPGKRRQDGRDSGHGFKPWPLRGARWPGR